MFDFFAYFLKESLLLSMIALQILFLLYNKVEMFDF